MARTLKLWLPVALWMGIIFVASTDLGSGEHTASIIGPVLRWLLPNVTPEQLELAHHLMRKGGHLTEYGILALLVLRAVRGSWLPAPERWWRAAGVALLVAAAYAASDEFHQSFVASRGSSPVDVLIDSTGALLALAAVGLWRRWRTLPAPVDSSR